MQKAGDGNMCQNNSLMVFWEVAAEFPQLWDISEMPL